MKKKQRVARRSDGIKRGDGCTFGLRGACAETIALSRIAAEKGNVGVISDAGVAVMAGYGALKSAIKCLH